MIIDYTITKKQGNFRPEITINISIEEWEKALSPRLTSIEILSADKQWEKVENIPDPENVSNISSEHGQVKPFYLPFRPGKNPAYPEVEQALNELQEKHEAAVLEAYQSIAFELSGKIEPSAAYKKKIAPWVARQKMIKGVENE